MENKMQTAQLVDLEQFRGNISLNVTQMNSQVRHMKNREMDWEVFLPTKGKNLQRGFVWTVGQKRELIESILLGRQIPNFYFINSFDTVKNKDILIVIDGKQRLSTIFDFLDDKFTMSFTGWLDDYEFLFSELPLEYQRAITGFWLNYHIVNEDMDKRITDKEKIQWFKFINFAGTQQDKTHMEELN
jgi:uncharacterized protein with ParB-like and HNH nuclease domain